MATVTYDPYYYWASNNDCTNSSTDTSYVWGNWCNNTQEISTSDSTWDSWTTTGTITVNNSYCDSKTVWYEWSAEKGATHIGSFDSVTMPKKNHKERRKIRRQVKRYNVISEKRRIKSNRKQKIKELELKQAETKARELILDILPEDQREIYEKTGRVFVKGTKFDWLIRKSSPNSSCLIVTKIEKDKVTDMCTYYPDGRDLPADDRVLGYILHAKFNEGYLLSHANPMSITPGKHDVEPLLKEAANF